MSIIYNKVRCLHCKTCAHRMMATDRLDMRPGSIYSSFCTCQRVAFIGNPDLSEPALMVKPGTQYEYTS